MASQPADHVKDPFATETEQVAQRIQTTFRALIESVCGIGARPNEVSRSFGIHQKLGWQVCNVAYGPDPLPAMRFLPGRRGLETWAAAARGHSAASELADDVLNAADRFEALIRTHAADREMMEIMLESLDGPRDERLEERWRKQAFIGNTYIFGVRARTFLAAVFLHPSASRPGYFDMVVLRGLIGLTRTRPNVRWPFGQSVVLSGDEALQPRRSPLSPPLHDVTGVPLLEAFCSQPLPAVQRRAGESGMLEDELLPGPVGQSGETTIVTGEIIREVAPAHRTSDEEDAMFGSGVRTPSETLLLDHFVHHDLFGSVERELRVYNELISPMSRDPRDRLPVSETLQNLGRGLRRVRSGDAPGYPDMVELALRETGWRGNDFQHYRVRMRYPPIPVSVMVRHELPPAPRGAAERA